MNFAWCCCALTVWERAHKNQSQFSCRKIVQVGKKRTVLTFNHLNRQGNFVFFRMIVANFQFVQINRVTGKFTKKTQKRPPF